MVESERHAIVTNYRNVLRVEIEATQTVRPLNLSTEDRRAREAKAAAQHAAMVVWPAIAKSLPYSKPRLFMAAHVLVNCLMVTLPSPGRFAFIKRTITAHCTQTHSPRELVVVLDQGPAEVKVAIMNHVARLGRDDIRIIESPPAMTLGVLLNRACARGDVHCQWDDDDLHHPERVERQLSTLASSDADAVCIQEVIPRKSCRQSDFLPLVYAASLRGDCRRDRDFSTSARGRRSIAMRSR